MRNTEDAQIVSGIKEGDPIVSSGGYALPDNTKIKVEAAPAEKEADDKRDKSDKASDSKKPDDKDKE